MEKLKIPLFKVFMADTAIEASGEVLRSGYIGQGPKVDEFEEKLSKYLGNDKINTVNSGTSALHLALDIVKKHAPENKNEVLSVPITCSASNTPIVHNGLNIKWVDTDLDTCNLDLTDLSKKISDKTLAILVVHWGGYPVDLDRLKEIQEKCLSLYGYKPPVIEDCAHAFGATYKDKFLSNHGNFCMFSFQSIKHLTTVDGGILVSPEDSYHQEAKLLRWYGLDRTSSLDFRCAQIIKDAGYKFHMNDVSAAIGIENLRFLPEILSKHRQNAEWLYDALSRTKQPVKLLENKSDRNGAWWVFTIRVKNRDRFIKMMNDKGIGVSRVHDRNDKHLCFSKFKSNLPNTDIMCDEMICLPCGWWVTDKDRNYILNCIEEGW